MGQDQGGQEARRRLLGQGGEAQERLPAGKGLSSNPKTPRRQDSTPEPGLEVAEHNMNLGAAYGPT